VPEVKRKAWSLKMQNYLLICRSVTFAQRTARTLELAGISGVVMRAPRGLARGGCSYCVRIPAKRMPAALIAIKNAGLPPVRVFTPAENGEFQEVSA
jgi:rhodanese-related sulfurtransferase